MLLRWQVRKKKAFWNYSLENLNIVPAASPPDTKHNRPFWAGVGSNSLFFNLEYECVTIKPRINLTLTLYAVCFESIS